MSLYLSYLARTAKLVSRYPMTIMKLPKGTSHATSYLDNRVRQEFVRKQIGIKHVQGVDIYLNQQDRYTSPLIGITGEYEPEVTKLFKSIVREGGKVVDVGANVGWFTLIAARIVGNSGLVVSFEPESVSFGLLKKSVEYNDFRNVRLLNEAVTETDGTASLLLSPDGNTGANSIVTDNGPGSIEVKSSKLDTVAVEWGLDRIDLVKVDAEGAEPRVILGMKHLISRGQVQCMIVEWNPGSWTGKEQTLSMIFDFFDIYQINRLAFRRLRKLRQNNLPDFQANIFLRKKNASSVGEFVGEKTKAV